MNLLYIGYFNQESTSMKLGARCVEGIIHVGDHIPKLVKLDSATHTVLESISCSLTVTKIVSYGHELDFADEGLSAFVWVTGDGLSEIREDWCLFAESNGGNWR